MFFSEMFVLFSLMQKLYINLIELNKFFARKVTEIIDKKNIQIK